MALAITSPATKKKKKRRNLPVVQSHNVVTVEHRHVKITDYGCHGHWEPQAIDIEHVGGAPRKVGKSNLFRFCEQWGCFAKDTM